MTKREITQAQIETLSITEDKMQPESKLTTGHISASRIQAGKITPLCFILTPDGRGYTNAILQDDIYRFKTYECIAKVREFPLEWLRNTAESWRSSTYLPDEILASGSEWPKSSRAFAKPAELRRIARFIKRHLTN